MPAAKHALAALAAFVAIWWWLRRRAECACPDAIAPPALVPTPAPVQLAKAPPPTTIIPSTPAVEECPPGWVRAGGYCRPVLTPQTTAPAPEYVPVGIVTPLPNNPPPVWTPPPAATVPPAISVPPPVTPPPPVFDNDAICAHFGRIFDPVSQTCIERPVPQLSPCERSGGTRCSGPSCPGGCFCPPGMRLGTNGECLDLGRVA